MALWEYKVISSGRGGFATPALLEKFLNDLGRDEWEIVEFRSQPDNALAFSGLARRTTQRDWTLADAAAAAAKVEAEKLRAEFEAKFKAGTTAAGVAAETNAPSFIEEKSAPEEGFRKPVDTSHDGDPDAPEDEHDDWDKLTRAEEDELPTFFEAIKPHMRRNQRGPGQSVGVDYLAKKWDQTEDDVRGALAECGFELPADEDAKPVYVEYEGDLYWLNINRRGELWINTKEKPRPVFRAVKAQRVTIEDEAPAGDRRPAVAKTMAGEQETGDRGQKPDAGERRPEADERPAPEAEKPVFVPTANAPEPRAAREHAGREPRAGATLPEGRVLLDRIRPHMRRNRRGPGGSGSTTFLSRALKCQEADLKTAFAALGLSIPTSPNEKPAYAELGDEIWWLNLDSRGGLWINGREKKPGESLAAASAAADADTASELPAPAPTTEEPVPASSPDVAPSGATTGSPATGGVLAGLRLLLKPTRTGAIASKVDRLAEELAKPVEEFLGTLIGVGLKVPEKPREKPVFVEHAGEIFWLNKNAKGELWLNAKASKFAEKTEGGAEATSSDGGAEGEKKPNRRGGRGRRKTE